MNASAFKEMASTHAYFSARRGTFVFLDFAGAIAH
jgi:hypothetical protein